MPRPAWSVGGRFNSDGSGGTSDDKYTEFGAIRMKVDSGSLTLEYVNSLNGTVLDSFTILN